MLASTDTNPPKAASGRIFTPRTFTKRTRHRFTNQRMAALVANLGREPSYPERILISRIVTLEWELRRQDARLETGEELSAHALRARHAAENRLRLDLVALGLQPAQPPRRSLLDRLRDASGTSAPEPITGPPGPVRRPEAAP